MRDGVHSRQMNAPRPRSSHWHGRRVSSADIGPRPIKGGAWGRYSLDWGREAMHRPTTTSGRHRLAGIR
jgi:hypothetical protein